MQFINKVECNNDVPTRAAASSYLPAELQVTAPKKSTKMLPGCAKKGPASKPAQVRRLLLPISSL